MLNEYNRIVSSLTGLYDAGEARAIARVLLEDGFGLTLADVYAGKVMDFSPLERERLRLMTERLASGEPVQYVLGFARFGGREFGVSPGVLIPRPETLELTHWAAAGLRARAAEGLPHPRALDIGTGSGCIAVTLAATVEEAHVVAADISRKALETARLNAMRNGVEVETAHCDILAPDPGIPGMFDVIVSNPPYVCVSEKAGMHANVLGHEPPEALFVDDAHPLVFYEAIARYAASHLVCGGAVYVEINRRFGRETCDVFRQAGLGAVELRNDFAGNPRMVKAERNFYGKD